MTDLFKKPPIVAIDIGKSEIKVAMVERRRGGAKVRQLVRLPLTRPEGVEREWEIEQRLRAFVSERHLQKTTFVCCVPMQACTVKFFKLPPAPKDILEKMVRLEAETQIALPLSEVELDFQVQKGNGSNEVLIGAAKKGFLRSHLMPLERAGLKPRWVVASLLASWHCVNLLRANQPTSQPANQTLTVLVDIGASSTGIAIGQEGRLLAARSLSFGSDELTKAIASDRNITPAEAEWHKREEGLVNTGESTERWLRHLAEEIYRTVQTVSSQLSSTAPLPVGEGKRGEGGQLYLTGGGALVKGLAPQLQKRLNLAAELFTPIAVPTDGAPGYEASDLPFTTAALGAALSVAQNKAELNFAPKEGAISFAPRLFRRALPALLTVSILASLAATVIFQAQGSQLEAQVAALRAKQARQQRLMRDTVEIKNLPQKVRAMKRLLADLKDPRHDWLEVLYHLSKQLPASLWLSEISCTKGKEVILSGTALSRSSVADAVDVLQRIRVRRGRRRVLLFSDVSANYINARNYQGRTVIDFELTCVLVKEE